MHERKRQQRLTPPRSRDAKNLDGKEPHIVVTTREPSRESMRVLQVPPEGASALAASLANQMAHLLDTLPDAVIIADSAGRVQLGNRQVAVLCGHKQETLLGQSVEALMSSRFRAAHSLHRADNPPIRVCAHWELDCSSSVSARMAASFLWRLASAPSLSHMHRRCNASVAM